MAFKFLALQAIIRRLSDVGSYAEETSEFMGFTLVQGFWFRR